MFASTGDKYDRDATKDSVSNIRETKEFCVNIVSYEMRHQMNATSKNLPADIDEFKHAELKKTGCRLIECPRVLEAPASLECKLVEIIKLPGAANFAVFGEVVGVQDRIQSRRVLDQGRMLKIPKLDSDCPKQECYAGLEVVFVA